MLTYTSRAMVKEIKNKKFQIKNNIFETFKELTAQTPILYYY
jgi:flagellar basal body-associated protein FliL